MIKHNNFSKHKKLVRITSSGLIDWFSGRINLSNVFTVRKILTNPLKWEILSNKGRVIKFEAMSHLEREIWVRGIKELIINSNKTNINDNINYNNYLKLITNYNNFLELITAGIYIIRHSNNKKPKPKLIKINYMTGNIDWQTNSRNIIYCNILKGKATLKFKKVSEKIAPKKLCLTLIWTKKH